eukprot:TRINITY_DN6002_c0_g1_i1.p1 TRINITY_DN6002_c0_g1~~TRINITY_DN6002_c0_g1_i1.p1  ORF type:complete len:598 (-),score=34.34 TRINITY_DN6002_c0_g1_i1:1204-2997(-)
MRSYLSSILVVLCVIASVRGAVLRYSLPIKWSFQNPDGYYRNVILVNSTFVGPTLHATEGDIVYITVRNEMLSDVTSIHWHGFELPTSTFDGASQITQYPIAPHQSFEYVLNLTFVSAGTYYYHSHIPMQYHDGLYGAFIVHPRMQDGSLQYDEEIVIVLSDWFHADGSVLGASAIYAPSRVWQLNSPKSVLINGRGRFHCRDVPASNGCNPTMPYHVVTIKRGLKYRLRVICAATRVALSFAVQNHSYTVIQSQAENTIPIKNVKTVHMPIGSRYDVILEANQPIGNYWIGSEIIGCTSCNGFNSSINVQPSLGLRGYAILRYEGAEQEEPKLPFAAREEAAQPGSIILQNDEIVKPLVRRNIPEPTVRWSVNSTKISPEVHWRLNGFMFHHPTVPIIFDLKRNFSVESLVWSVNQGDVVDVIWHSHLNMDHPLHLHGFKFWLLGHGYDPFNTSHAIPSSPMRYDTVNVAGRGWIHFRFIADRPGPWMAHCHIDFHSVELMAFVVNVIPKDRKDLELPAGYSTCDSFPAILPQPPSHPGGDSSFPPFSDFRDLVSAQRFVESVVLGLIMLAIGVLLGIIIDRHMVSSKFQRGVANS